MRKPAAESNPVSIGPAEPEEAKAIAALIQRAFAPYRGRLQPEPSALTETADSIRSILQTDSILVARRAAMIIGCVSVQRRADAAYLRRLAVEPGKGAPDLAARSWARLKSWRAARASTVFAWRPA